MSSHKHSAGRPQGRNQRKQYVINPKFQWKYAWLTAIAVFLITASMSSILYGLLHHQARMRMMHPETYTASVTLIIFLFGVGFAGVSAIGVGLWSMLVTHRFCGPLYVMQQAMTILEKGRIPKLRNLRRKDEFKEFYDVFSKAVDAIRDRRVTELEHLHHALEAARSCVDADDTQRHAALDTVLEHLSNLEARARQGIVEEIPASDSPSANPATCPSASPA